MARSRRRRKRRKQNTLIVAVSVAIFSLVLWYCLDWLFTPNVVARVLFAETANCTPQERMLVAGVMKTELEILHLAMLGL